MSGPSPAAVKAAILRNPDRSINRHARHARHGVRSVRVYEDPLLVIVFCRCGQALGVPEESVQR